MAQLMPAVIAPVAQYYAITSGRVTALTLAAVGCLGRRHDDSL